MDHRRIDRYMENHFSDEFGNKICQLFVDGDNLEEPRYEWDLQYLEQRINLQEELIDAVADKYKMINRSLAAELTKMCKEVDDCIYDCYGDSFISPTGKVIDMAKYMFHMEPEIYYDIAQNIIATTMDHIIDALERDGEYYFDYFWFKIAEKRDKNEQDNI